MSVVSVVKGFCLIVWSLKIIDTSNKNTTFGVISVMCVMSVVSVMRGLYLIEQTLELIDCSDENTSCHVMSVKNVTSVVRALLYLFGSCKYLIAVIKTQLSVL